MMFSIQRAMLLSSVLLFGLVTACAQTRPKPEQEKPKQDEPKFEVTVTGATGKEGARLLKESERRDAIRGKYYEERRKCSDLLKAHMLEGAETVCKSALKLAQQLEENSQLERSSSYEAVGHVMLGRQRYQEALEYYSHALDAGQPVLKETDAELARLHGNLAMTHHLLGDLDKALELYRKAGKMYQAAYEEFGKDDRGDEWVQNMRESYLKSLKSLLRLHRKAADEAGAASEVEEVEKLLNSLP